MARALHMGVVASQGGGAAGPLIDFADLTGDRASEAAFWDPRTPAFEQGVGDAARVIDSGSDFSAGAGWGLVDGTLTADDDGDADFAEDDDAGAYGYLRRTVDVSGTECDWSIKIRQTGTPATFPLLHTTIDGDIASWSLNTETGATHSRIAGDPGATITVTDDGAGYWLVEIHRTIDAVLPTSLQCTIYLAYSSTLSGSGSTSLTGGVHLKEHSITDNDAGWLPDDVLRIFSDGACLFEESRTNLCPDSSLESGWSGTAAAPTVSALAAPDGGDAYEVEDDNPSNVEYTQRTFSLSSTGSHAVSLFVEKSAGSIPEIYFNGSTATITGGVIRLRLDTSDGSTHTDSGSPSDVTVDDCGDWWRLSFVVDVTVTGTVTFRLYPAIASAKDASSSLSETGTVAFWGVQVEEGEFPTAPIRTSGGSAARATEHGTLASAPADIRSGRWSIVVRPGASSQEVYDATATMCFLGFAGGGSRQDRIQLVPGTTSGTVRVQVRQGGALRVQSGELTFARGQALTLTLDSAAGEITVSGATSGDGTSSGTAWTFADTTLYVGTTDAVDFPFSGVLYPPEAA